MAFRAFFSSVEKNDMGDTFMQNMIYLLSPAKSLDYQSETPPLRGTMPRFLACSEELVKLMKPMSATDLESLMGVSSNLAELNVKRFRDWKLDYSKPEARQAILAFKGGVYQGLAVEEWEADDFVEAQKSLRILSGLYGVLRPLDLILPYRLEMGTKVADQHGSNLYHFWGSLLTESLNKELSGENDAVINLASKEYFSAVKGEMLVAPVITPVFKDWKNGKLKIISFFAKKARGQMAAWAIRSKVSSPPELKKFNLGGYCFDPDLSDARTYVFTRD